MMVTLSKLSNVCLYLVTCALIGTGLLLEFRLDENSGGVLGFSRDDWSESHLAIALAFLGLLLIHLLFHLRWIAAMWKGGRPWALLLAAGIAAIIIGGLLLAPDLSWISNASGAPPRHIDD